MIGIKRRRAGCVVSAATSAVFAQLARIARESYDRIVGLVLDEIAVDGCITKAPGGGEVAGPSPVDRRKQGMKRSVLVEGYGIPLGRVLAGAHRHDSPLLDPTLDLLADLGPLPEEITVHLDAGYDSGKTRQTLTERGLRGRDRAQGREGADPGQPALARRAHQRLAQRLQPVPTLLRTPRKVIDAFFDLADAIITVRSLIRQAWTTHRWDTRPARRR